MSVGVLPKAKKKKSVVEVRTKKEKGSVRSLMGARSRSGQRVSRTREAEISKNGGRSKKTKKNIEGPLFARML